MAFLDDIEAAALEPAVNNKCGVALLKEKNPDHADDIDQGIDQYKEVSARKVSEILAGYGMSLSVNTIQRHRRRECQCP